MSSLWGKASVTAASVAKIINISCVSSLTLAGQRVGAPQQLDLLPHRIGEMQVQVIAAWIAFQCALRLRDRPVDDGETLPEHAHRGGVELSLVARQRFLQLGDGRVGRRPPATSGSESVIGRWARDVLIGRNRGLR